jgi:hypothetical protein
MDGLRDRPADTFAGHFEFDLKYEEMKWRQWHCRAVKTITRLQSIVHALEAHRDPGT